MTKFRILFKKPFKCFRYHNLTIFSVLKYQVKKKGSVISNFSKEWHYLEIKVGLVYFTKAHGLVKFHSPHALQARGL